MKNNRSEAIIGIVGLSLLAGIPPLRAQETILVRDHHEMVFDAAAEQLVLFGGNSRNVDNEYTYVADTWTLAAEGWKRLATDGPNPRSSFSMAYDAARKRTVVFGGYFQGSALDDTWTFDGKQWNQVKAGGPAARMSPALCFDPQSRLVLLFGGLADGLYGDTWGWNGETWSLRSEKGPVGRNRMAIFRDARRNSVVIHGGYVRVDGQGRSTDDMWEWKGEKWSEVDQGPVKPPPLSNHRAVYDDRRSVAVLFGGSSERGVYLDETWEWNGATWTRRTPEPRPSARGNFSMAYDAKLKKVVIQGGKNSDGETLSDSWMWDGEVWTSAATPP